MLCQVPSAAGKKKNKKHGDKVYGGLESARPDRRVSSTRYTSAPSKDDPKSRKDDPKSQYTSMMGATAPKAHEAAEADKADKDTDELQMPVVGENDYLMPQSGAAADAYVDVVPDDVHGIISSFLLLYNDILLLLYTLEPAVP